MRKETHLPNSLCVKDILVPRSSSSRIQVLAWFETSVCSLFWWIAWREKRCPNNFCWWLCRSVTSMGLMQNSMLIYMQKPADGNVHFLQEFRDLKKLFVFLLHLFFCWKIGSSSPSEFFASWIFGSLNFGAWRQTLDVAFKIVLLIWNSPPGSTDFI